MRQVSDKTYEVMIIKTCTCFKVKSLVDYELCSHIVIVFGQTINPKFSNLNLQNRIVQHPVLYHDVSNQFTCEFNNKKIKSLHVKKRKNFLGNTASESIQSQDSSSEVLWLNNVSYKYPQG